MHQKRGIHQIVALPQKDSCSSHFFRGSSRHLTTSGNQARQHTLAPCYGASCLATAVVHPSCEIDRSSTLPCGRDCSNWCFLCFWTWGLGHKTTQSCASPEAPPGQSGAQWVSCNHLHSQGHTPSLWLRPSMLQRLVCSEQEQACWELQMDQEGQVCSALWMACSVFEAKKELLWFSGGSSWESHPFWQTPALQPHFGASALPATRCLQPSRNASQICGCHATPCQRNCWQHRTRGKTGLPLWLFSGTFDSALLEEKLWQQGQKFFFFLPLAVAHHAPAISNWRTTQLLFLKPRGPHWSSCRAPSQSSDTRLRRAAATKLLRKCWSMRNEPGIYVERTMLCSPAGFELCPFCCNVLVNVLVQGTKGLGAVGGDEKDPDPFTETKCWELGGNMEVCTPSPVHKQQNFFRFARRNLAHGANTAQIHQLREQSSCHGTGAVCPDKRRGPCCVHWSCCLREGHDHANRQMMLTCWRKAKWEEGKQGDVRELHIWCYWRTPIAQVTRTYTSMHLICSLAPWLGRIGKSNTCKHRNLFGESYSSQKNAWSKVKKTIYSQSLDAVPSHLW